MTTDNPQISARPTARLRRFVRSLFRIAGGIVAGIGLLLVILFILLQLPFVAGPVARTALSLANPWVGTSATIADARGTWLTGLLLTGVRISDSDGSLLIQIDSLRVKYDLPALLGGELRFRSVYLARPIVHSGEAPDGDLEFLYPFRPTPDPEPDTTEGLRVTGGTIDIRDGEFQVSDVSGQTTLDVGSVLISARDLAIGEEIRFALDTLGASYLPGMGSDSIRVGAWGAMDGDLITVGALNLRSSRTVIHGAGAIALPADTLFSPHRTSFVLDASPVAYRDIHPLVSAFGQKGEASLHLVLTRGPDSMHAEARGSFANGGSVELNATAVSGGKRGPVLTGHVRAAGVSIAGFTGLPDSNESITVDADISGEGESPSSFTGKIKIDGDAENLVAGRRLAAVVQATFDEGAADIRCSGSLDQLTFRISGQARPFSDPPTYALTASAAIPASGVARDSTDILHLLRGLRSTLEAKGTGFDPLTGKANARLRADWKNHPDFTSLALDATSADSTARINALLKTVEGFLRIDARARPGPPEIVLQALEFSRIDLSSILGTQETISLSGSASGAVRGTDLTNLDGNLSLRLDSSRVGTTRISRAEVDARAEKGSVTATIDGETSDGTFHIEGSGEPFGDEPTVAIRDLSFKRLDLGGLLLGKDGATDLNGSARLKIRLEPEPADGTDRRGPGLTGDVQLNLEKSRVFRQDIVSAAVAGELTGGAAAAEVDIRTPEGGAYFSGNVGLFQEFPDVRLSEGRLEHLNLGALAGIDSLDTDITATLTADLEGPFWRSAAGTVALELLPSRINREPIQAGRFAADIGGGRATVKGQATLLSGSLDFTASGSYVTESTSFAAAAHIQLDDLGKLTRDSSMIGSSARLDFTSEGIWGAAEATRISGRLTAGGSLDSLQIDSVLALFSVAGRTIEVDTLLVRSNAGTVGGSGTIAAFDSTGATSSDFTLNASLASFHRLRKITGLDFSTGGRARLVASLTGNGRDGNLEVRSDITSVGWGDILIPALNASGSVRMSQGAVGGASGLVTGRDLAYGALVFDSLAAQARDSNGITSFLTSINLESGESLSAGGSGEQLEKGYALALDSLRLNVGGRTWLLEDRARIVMGSGLRVDGFTLASGSRVISARGTLGPEGEQDFSVRIDSLAFDRIARLLGRPNLGGNLTFSGLVAGPAERPEATGRMALSLTSDGTQLSMVESDVDWKDGLLKITSLLTPPDRTSLKAVVSIPADLPFGSPIPVKSDNGSGKYREFLLQTDGFDLSVLGPFLNSETVAAPRGLLRADLALRGEAGKISGTGRLDIDTGFVRLNALGVDYSDIRLQAQLDGSDFRIDTLSVRSGPGDLTGGGTISLAAIENPSFDLRLLPRQFLGINSQSIRVLADGSVGIAGDLEAPSVSGNITILESHYVVPETAGEGHAEAVELTDYDYAILRERFGYRRSAKAAPTAGDSMKVSLDIVLRFPRKSWIRKKSNPSLSVEIEGDLRVRSEPGQPLSLVGTLKPVPGRSYVSQFGRQFEITSGEIRFNGPPDQFAMNVDSEYKVPARSGSGMSEAVIRMKVERKLDRFEFSLTSDPPMDQPDILSYLTTGTATTGAFASTSSQGNIATSAALEQVVGAIGGLTEDKIPLDIFQIRQDGARGITIVAGNYVSSRTYLGVRYPILIQQSSQDSYYDTGTEFEVEYQATPWLYLNSKGGSSRLMLMFKSRYAY